MVTLLKKKRKRGRPKKLVHYAIVKRLSRKEYCTIHGQWLTVQYTYRTNHPTERITFCLLCENPHARLIKQLNSAG